MLSEIHKALQLFIIGACAAPNPAPVYFLLVAMPKESILDKKEKHAKLQHCCAVQDQMYVVKCWRI